MLLLARLLLKQEPDSPDSISIDLHMHLLVAYPAVSREQPVLQQVLTHWLLVLFIRSGLCTRIPLAKANIFHEFQRYR